jgi:hypothetical protein
MHFMCKKTIGHHILHTERCLLFIVIIILIIVIIFTKVNVVFVRKVEFIPRPESGRFSQNE